MSVLAELWPGRLTDAEAAVGPYSQEAVEQLRSRGAAMAHRWAGSYAVPWAIDSQIQADAREWSAVSAREVVRYLESPKAALGLVAWGTIIVGVANMATAGIVAWINGPLFLVPLASAGALVSIRGFGLLARHRGVCRQHRAGIPPLRARLQAELETAAVAALDARRTRLWGPRRPIPKHPFEELLPIQAQQVAAAWMRHLGEFDAAVLKVSDDDPAPGIQIASSGYLGRVWPFEAPVPEFELRLLESEAKKGVRRPLLFSRGPFPDVLVSRADRVGMGLFTCDPWAATIRSANQVAARQLRRGLRDADGIAT